MQDRQEKPQRLARVRPGRQHHVPAGHGGVIRLRLMSVKLGLLINWKLSEEGRRRTGFWNRIPRLARLLLVNVDNLTSKVRITQNEAQ